MLAASLALRRNTYNNSFACRSIFLSVQEEDHLECWQIIADPKAGAVQLITVGLDAAFFEYQVSPPRCSQSRVAASAGTFPADVQSPP